MWQILLPIDDSELSHAAIPFARDLATRLKASLILMTAGNVPESRDRAVSNEKRLEMLSQTAAKFGLHAGLRVDMSGDAVEDIPHVAKEEDVDLIVMSTHGRSGLSELVQGSTAEQVVRDGLRPVVLIRPGMATSSTTLVDEGIAAP